VPKIQSQSGVSLADTYDVEGSIAGVENLESKDVSLFDEMGGRVFAERLRSFILNISTTAIAQSTTFDISFSGIPDSPNRIIAACLTAPVAGRVAHAALHLSQDTGDTFFTDQPIVAWDDAVDPEVICRFALKGANQSNAIVMRPAGLAFEPLLMTRMAPDFTMPELKLRGKSSAFGAGTIIVTAIVLIARANPETTVAGTPSSHGLPVPSW